MTQPSQSELSVSASLEALLFVAPGPVTYKQLAVALEISIKEVKSGLADLEMIYLNRDTNNQFARGLRLQYHEGQIQFTTAPEAASAVERLLGLDTHSSLSRAAIEVLTIVAYRSPITRPQIEAIRGVNSDGALKSLTHKSLIQAIGRASTPGRPMLYSVTTAFLQHFGLNSLSELPELPPLAES